MMVTMVLPYELTEWLGSTTIGVRNCCGDLVGEECVSSKEISSLSRLLMTFIFCCDSGVVVGVHILLDVHCELAVRKYIMVVVVQFLVQVECEWVMRSVLL
jgi:hypothetical protein